MAGDLDEARVTVRTAFEQYRGWEILLRRLVRDGYPDLAPETLEALLPEAG